MNVHMKAGRRIERLLAPERGHTVNTQHGGTGRTGGLAGLRAQDWCPQEEIVRLLEGKNVVREIY